MPVSPTFKAFVVEQLAGAGPITARSMFGGVGLYCHGLFFALIDDDTLYLKVDDDTRPDFERIGSEPFRPYGDDTHVMQYYALPVELLEDRAELLPWVERALGAARRKVGRKPKRPRP
ncbi:MAG TPA: TfoX/Sxy family protein [Gemmatimonadales bacterium]|nr:TfoX/Sxy family protein [Gemmatimonadales bacterium]